MSTIKDVLNNVEKPADMQTSLVYSSMNMRDEFQKWLENGNAKKFSPQVAIECLDRISEYIISKKISCSIWKISKPNVYKPVYQKVMDAKLLRITQREIYKVFTVVGQLYAKFLKEKPWDKLSEMPLVTAVDEIMADRVFLASSDNKTDSTISRSLPDINTDDVIAWLVTQLNANGTLYLDNVMRSYMSALRNAPQKLTLDNSVSRNVFACHTVAELDSLWQAFKAAPDYIEVNRTLWHGQLSAGLGAYRRYIKYLEENGQPEKNDPRVVLGSTSQTIKEIPQQLTAEPRHVDFAHPELCMGCDPVTCIVEGKSFYSRNWRDLIIALTEHFLLCNPKAKELYHKSVYTNGERPFFLKEKPQNIRGARQISNGYWVFLNLGIKDLVFTIGKLCQFCGVSLKDVEITYVPKTNGGSGEKTMVKSEYGSARFAQQPVREAFRSWLSEHNPEWSNGTVTMHYSDAYYLFNNERGITLEAALTTDDGLQKAYDAIERHFINNPTQTNNPSGSARGYLRSLRMLKDFLYEKFPELFNKDSIAIDSASIVPDSLIEVLTQNYASGFRFETTALRLLSTTAGVEVDERMQAALKRSMFRRNDDIYFLLDTVVDATTRKDIVEFAEAYLKEYGCFEISELYKLYEDKVNPKCIGDADDFGSFYEQIGNSGVRCVAAPQIGNRIVRFSNGNVWGAFKEVSAKIVAAITDEFYGSVNEDDLHLKFSAFSTDLLAKILKNCAADELVRVEINGSICYQTFDALGLPENFSDVLSETLEKLGDIGLEPSQDVLHTAISLKLGVNFLEEFNLPDWDTYRRLITVFYNDEPRREWKRNIFGEVTY